MIDTATLASAIVGALALTSAWAAASAGLRRDRGRAKFALGLGALVAVGGIAGSVVALRETYAMVATAEPAQKASRLSAGMADALLPTQIGWSGAFVVVALALVGLRPNPNGDAPQG